VTYTEKALSKTVRDTDVAILHRPLTGSDMWSITVEFRTTLSDVQGHSPIVF